MHLLDINTLPLYGVRGKGGSSSQSVSNSDGLTTKETDIEASAGAVRDQNMHS